ncbi:MAG: FtsX-like permease family protein [Oceanospirillales bacterium TMED33]|nr:ABC transporter permease [Gammaproteobacteria bacterium]RPG20743.1 MAG: FtsX-like permease family protein [Oceanospirillales bacterium TMED33]
MIALRLLWREFVSGQLSLLAIALVVSVAAMTTTEVLTDRIDRAMRADAAALLGGDLKLRGPRPIDPDWLAEADVLGVSATETIEFPSVIGSQSNFELTGLKIVTDGYPLKGKLEIADSRAGTGYPASGIPAPGTAWADPQLVSKLDIDVGDTVSVGEIELEITQILVFEPDRGGSFVSLTPRLLMNQADLADSQLIQPGSRVRYITLFADGDLERFETFIEPRLDISQRLRGVVDGRPEVGSALARATTYLSLAGLLTVLLSGAAIAMTANRWASDHIADSALFRTFGLSGLEALFIFTAELTTLAGLASGLGVLLGYGLQIALVDSIAGLLTISLPEPSIKPAILGLLTGFVTLFGFAAPALIMLANVPPIRVLKRDYHVSGLGQFGRYGFALLAIGVLGFLYSDDLLLTGWVVLAVVILVGLVTVMGRLVIRGLGPLERFGPAWRFGIQQLARDPQASGGQLMVFAMTALAIGMVALIRFDLITTWETQVPEDAPNTFALNITDQDQTSFVQTVVTLGGDLAPLYPIVRGRLETVNGIPLVEHLAGTDPPGSVRRELSLTESEVLGRDNQIDRGRFFTKSDGPGLVTVESKLFDELDLELGDVIQYTIGPDRIAAEVIGSRVVQWDSMLPNFFMIFSPGTLEPFESTRLTSMRLPNPSQDTAAISRAFRQVTMLSVDAILNQIRGILDRVSQAVSVVLYFVLVGGILVLAASIQTSLPERRKESAILRSLGGSDRLLSQSQWAEFLTLGVISGCLAAVGTELLGWLVYNRIFNLEWSTKWQIWVLTPVLTGTLVGLVGRWSARQARQMPPAQLLKIADT